MPKVQTAEQIAKQQATARKIRAWEAEQRKLPGLFLPIELTGPNKQRRNHWAANGRRAKMQRLLTANYMRINHPNLRPGHIVLTRYGPRRLDGHDNLRLAFKAVVDGMQDVAKVPDNDPLWYWDYKQQIAPGYGFRVEVVG